MIERYVLLHNRSFRKFEKLRLTNLIIYVLLCSRQGMETLDTRMLYIYI